MARKGKTQIFSIFGQCERVIADMMTAEGKLTKIPASAIPFEVARNEMGQVASFAVIVPHEHLAEFNNRCADLRA